MGTGTGSAALRGSGAFGNYHTHTRHCDGNDEPRDFAEAAIRKGMQWLGFSGHNVLPFQTDWTMPEKNLESYLREVREAKARYTGRLEIFLGIEADYIPGVTSPNHPRIRDLGLDFVLGSVHFVELPGGDHSWTVDGSRQELETGLARVYGGNIRALVERYYALVGEMAEETKPDIIGHFDVVKKNNGSGGLFSEEAPWYRAAVRAALQAVGRSGSVMEINTGGIVRNTSGVLYPSEWILEQARRLGIPIMINADAHRPQDIDGYFSEAAALLRSLGFATQRQLTSAGWVDVPLPA
jgi:histidinol-phosphatase (PHP family)